MSDDRQALLTQNLKLKTHNFVFKASADKVNDLDAVAFREAGLRPLGAADDFAITLNRQSLGNKREFLDEIVERCVSCDFAYFAVDFDAQGFSQSFG